MNSKIARTVAFFIIICILIVGFIGYRSFFSRNVTIRDGIGYLYIPTGSTLKDVESILKEKKWLLNYRSFHLVSKIKRYASAVKPGRYRLKNGMSNLQLVTLLRSGMQEPVLVRFQNVKNLQDFAGKIAHQLEADSARLMSLLNDPNYLRQYNITPQTSYILFLPNTYEFYWNTSAEQFMDRMNREKNRFWNGDRVAQADSIGLNIAKVVILASIVEKETAKDSEKPTIAGVYMNRLNKGWPLQADPTVLFAWDDRSIRRVYLKHAQIDSPYNTYKNLGLPPGPICLPSIASIESVLHYDHHSYMFFCAKEDLSGYHAFATNYSDHQKNARKYQKVLDRQGKR